MKYEACIDDISVLGVQIKGGITTFAVQNHHGKECVLLLYPRDGSEILRIPMEEGEGWPGVSAVSLRGEPLKDCEYLYELAGELLVDPYGTRIVGREQWADFTAGAAPGTSDKSVDLNAQNPKIKSGCYYNDDYRWKRDVLPRIPKEDMMVYRAHVRGFSMKQKGSDQERGTFRAIERRLPYLQEMGITTLELMPVYEFEERMAWDSGGMQERGLGRQVAWDKVNYWGYTSGNYFAPKASYLGEGHGPEEIKRLVAKLHQRQMECILEFYFDNKLNPHYIIDVLRYWAREYHVDGFHLICGEQVAALAAQDPCLGGRKLFYQWFSNEAAKDTRNAMELFSYNEGFLCGVRRFVNQQGGALREFTENIRRQEKEQGFINFLAWNNGFTLYDSLTYTETRNQANGEENQDGVVWNYSVNCGEEGPSRKRSVQALRDRQIMNCLSILMLSQGVPMIWMGDECGNSQQGNNNAYCQDNEIGWKDWNNTRRGRALYQFLCKLARLRRRYPILHGRMPMQMYDYLHCGYPDLSYHGCNGWQMELEGSTKAVGMLYCTKYGEDKDKWDKLKDDFIYICCNFSETEQSLALPVLPRDFGWHSVLDTSREEPFEEWEMKVDKRSFLLSHRTVCVLAGRRRKKK